MIKLIDTQKFLNILKNDEKFKAELKSITIPFETVFVAQDYTGDIRLFNKKPIPYYAVGYGSEYRMWDRTDDKKAGSSFMFELGKYDEVFTDYDSRVIQIQKFNIKDIKKMKFKVVTAE